METYDTPPEHEGVPDCYDQLDDVGEDSTSLTFKLISSPSVSLWKAELHFLVRGERDEQLFRVGDAGGYILTLWDEMEDESLGRATFYEALSEFIQEWQPSATEDPRSLYNILSLVGAFTPPHGFIKIASYLKYGDWSDLFVRPHAGSDSQIDLHLKALVTLRSYFRVAPLTSSRKTVPF